MKTIEEYIATRKAELKIDEKDRSMKAFNMKAIMEMVIDYFNSYIDMSPGEESTLKIEARVDRYRHSLRAHSQEIIDWYVDMYAAHGNKLDVIIKWASEKNDIFLLTHREEEFRQMSYDLYAEQIKKLPYLREQTEMLVAAFRDRFRISSTPGPYDEVEASEPYPNDMDEWMSHTQKRYGVNIGFFIGDWCIRYIYDREREWPADQKIKTSDKYIPYKYNYRSGGDVCGLSSLYKRISWKPFIKGRKRELEYLIVENLSGGDGEEGLRYWKEYSKRAIESMS